MHSFWFGQDLPAEFAHPDVREKLSFNGQLHFQCRSCTEVVWGDITFAKLALRDNRAFPCPNCKRKALEAVRFNKIQSRVCERCGGQTFAASSADARCPHCGHTFFTVDQTLIVPPYPRRFFALEGRSTPFGDSVEEDIEFLMQYVRALRMSPQFHQVCVHLIAFIESLFKDVYGSSAEAVELLNAASALMRTVYRENGNLDAAYLSIAIMIDGYNIASDPIQRAVFGFNICQNVYSVLARRSDEPLSIRFGFNLKQYGVWLSRQTLEVFKTTQDERVAHLRAQQKWLLGDILKAGDPSEAEIDEALTYFDAALSDPALPSQMAGYVRESALTARAKRRTLSPSERQNIRSQLDALTAAHLDQSAGIQRLQSLGDLLQAEALSGRTDSYRAFALKCLGEALVYAANDPGNMLRHTGSVLSRLVAGYAAERYRAGDPLGAIAGVEAFRSLAIQHGRVARHIRHHVHPFEVELMTRRLMGLTVEPSEAARTILTTYTELLESDLRELLESDARRFIVWCEVWEGEFFLSKLRWRDGRVHVETTTRQIADLDIKTAMSLPMADAEPQRDRTRQVKAALTSGWTLFQPLLEDEPVEHAVVFVGPSMVGGWPLDSAESLHTGAQIRPASFAPSIRLAAAVRGSAPGRSIERVLVVAYAGSDLPGIRREVDAISGIYGPRTTVLGEKAVTKPAVLKALSDSYDVIHFCGHGTFDYLEPMKSRIYLRPGTDDESGVTADDLLDLGTVGRRPVIVLSACSSALVLPNGANNFLGLAGAFLRTGATGIVGTRWPIADASAVSFSTHFHGRLAAGDPVDRAVAFAKNTLRRATLDEWTAFMAIGN